MIRVVVADDHHLVRAGIVALLEKEDDIKVIAEAEDGLKALAAVEKHEPDVLILDIGMPGLNGLHALSHVPGRSKTTETVMLSIYDDQALVRQALRSNGLGPH